VKRFLWLSLLALVGLVFVCLPAPVRADGGDPTIEPLLARLEAHAAKFEAMKKRGSYTFSGRVDEVDGDGKASSTKEMVLDVKAQANGDPISEIVRYTEDGKDKTSEAQEKAKKRRAEGKKTSATNGRRMRDFHLPFLATERARYTFSLAERSNADPNQVRIAFVPKTPAEDAYKGSAWIDEKAGEVLSVGFSLSKNPTFVDHIDVTVEFGLPTTLGRAPSKIAFEAKGGFLVIKKRYKGSATITNPRVL
jgi:hypothetical protein